MFREAGRYVSERVWGGYREFGQGTAMLVLDDKNVIAVMIHHNLDRGAGVIEISGAADSARWLTKPVLWELFAYPFKQLQCQAVVMRVDPENSRLDRILKAYGFARYDIPRLRGRNKPEAVYVLGDDAWRANGFHKEY